MPASLTGAERTPASAASSIRVRLAQESLAKKEEELVAELQKKIPVRIDEAALAGVRSAPVSDAGTP
ncbi:MAG: hypothetical protein EOP08_10225 [Proteobacteria bacterium]|nr:MAG: hypothetical protein EOP08_10225 [Pseudomonadota bacterium]